MRPIKLAILWHQHQPYYKMNDEFILPWVRLHAVKDYLDLPTLLFKYPKIKQTINLVPSLILQIEEYLKDNIDDRILKLTKKSPSSLSYLEKKEVIESFFLCNEENMIKPYSRYFELFKKSKIANSVELFSDQDFLDLQVWYLLTWIGPISRNDYFVKRLFEKNRNFSTQEKNILTEFHYKIMNQIISTMKSLVELDQIEVSCSPMYHPILPLLCDTNVLLDNMPTNNLPNKRFSYSEDSRNQINIGKEYFLNKLGFNPKGFWPSEGSISNEVLNQMIDYEIEWVATDEMMLLKSANDLHRLDKYFPWKYVNNEGKPINIFFRDHNLSDKIGFNYSNWNESDAANDFVNKVLQIRNEIFNEFGENGLEKACISVILDGENCWEFYKNNGFDFLNELYRIISDCSEIETVRFSEINSNIDKTLNSVKSGSWINANFNIWIGHQEHLQAWTHLSILRDKIEELKNKIHNDKFNEIMNLVYIAEGSDWFWWYGDSHFAPNKYDFDILFRYYLSQIYEKLDMDIPQELLIPINNIRNLNLIEYQNNNNYNWTNPGKINFKLNSSSMHQVGEILTNVHFCVFQNQIDFKFIFNRELDESEKLIIDINNKQIQINGNKTKEISFANEIENDIIKLRFQINTFDNKINYPNIGNFILKI